MLPEASRCQLFVSAIIWKQKAETARIDSSRFQNKKSFQNDKFKAGHVVVLRRQFWGDK